MRVLIERNEMTGEREGSQPRTSDSWFLCQSLITGAAPKVPLDSQSFKLLSPDI
jgi:hypothetical protein